MAPVNLSFRCKVGAAALILASNLAAASAAAEKSPAERGRPTTEVRALARGVQVVKENEALPTRRLVLQLSRELFLPLVDRKVDRLTPVTDFVLGTPVSGQARTVGTPHLYLQRDNHRAAFIVTLTGTTVSRTVGRNGPAVIYTRAETHFAAAKRITFQPGKGFVGEPALINTITKTTNEGIGSTRRGVIGRMVRRRASREVAETRPVVDAIAKQRAESRITAAFDHFLESRLARLNRSTEWREAVATTLGGDGDPNFACCTRDGYVQISISRGPQEPMVTLPELTKPRAPIQVWVHNSLIGGNLAGIIERFDAVRPGANLAQQALEVVPSVLKTPLGLPERAAQAEIPVDYETVEDWIVVQVEPPALDGEETEARRVVKQPIPALPARR